MKSVWLSKKKDEGNIKYENWMRIFLINYFLAQKLMNFKLWIPDKQFFIILKYAVVAKVGKEPSLVLINCS